MVDRLPSTPPTPTRIGNSAAPGGGGNVRLFAALLHEEQVVIAQIAVPQDSTETTQVPNLLQEVDLTGKTVTADANPHKTWSPPTSQSGWGVVSALTCWAMYRTSPSM